MAKKFKSLKRRIDDEGNNGGCSAGKKSLIELIDLLVGTAAEKGERDEMQDEHLSIPDFGDKVAAGAYSGEAQRIGLFGIFDGHGGARAAQFAKQRITEQLSTKFPSGGLSQIEKDIKRITIDIYKKTDEEFLKEASRQRPHWKDGSTATTVLLVNNTLYIANIGDSAAVMARRREAEGGGKTALESLAGLRLTRDHTPLDPGERERLTRISNIRIIDGRVNGQLEVSRSFGDYQFKRHGVSCLPDVKKYELVGGRDRFMLIACDGLWKCFSPQEAVEKTYQLISVNPVLKRFASGEGTLTEAKDIQAAQRALNAICSELVREAVLQRLSGDNHFSSDSGLMSLLPWMRLVVAVTLWLVLLEAAPRGLAGKEPPDRRWNTCSTANAILQHGEVIRPDCRTECFCDDGVLLCKDLCTSNGLAEVCNQPHPQNHQDHSPPLVWKSWGGGGAVSGKPLHQIGDRKNKDRRTCTSKQRFHCSSISIPQVVSSRNKSLFAESLCKSRSLVATQWSPCSKTCGLGVSFRVTNNNAECRNQTEAQLCHWKPCSRVPSRRCAPTRRVEQPQTFRLVIVDNRTRQLARRVAREATGAVEFRASTGAPPASDSVVVCESVRRYRPKYCTPCDSLEAHCCVPIRTKTTRVNFRCSDGRLIQHNLEWIKRCACHPTYCKYLYPAID
ncbi:Integrin-linked kinase-associated serine/threonine phosphatase 2C [Echinococcus granulosus]|uniref:Integrin-linked kinase-associated serine/threonine phosphatase 2C n=1 Tax=Echinococcus granulosus TaxID=6210 RepID=W6UEH5_ECHGR|nr:Integrin-linked kinase-associated serine/threonine phosphatase 2C [Echinococcus granulosus]EUB56482.1 Integrin-linked kinase-associated serine/threonine phosphatase 2C [Echinococcus granulosus]